MQETLQISLAAARINARMTQSEVAEKMHVGKQTIVNWEKGKTEPTVSQGRALSEIYGIPMDTIIFFAKQSN